MPETPAQPANHPQQPARGEPPLAVMARWPRHAPLAALISGGDDRARARWSILARPGRTVVSQAAWTPDQAEGDRGPGTPSADRAAAGLSPISPFSGGWIGCLTYDAGRDLEPAAERGSPAERARADRTWPRAVWMRCEDAWVHDAATGDWSRIGAPPRLEPRPVPGAFGVALDDATPGERAHSRYERAVERALEYIRAGDVYQVNLTHRLTARFDGDARAFALRMLAGAAPWYGAYLEWGQGEAARALVSASPELLMAVEPLRTDAPRRSRIWTRPMKGTRPAGPGAADELHANIKENAELNMIVDLLRNDLGRVCELGSVRVSTPREIERHHGGSLLQATATVEGLLTADATGEVNPWAALRAMFPGGSVTGAPKIRAMQIIDELEESRRGPYCGAIGYVSDSGNAAFSIAIRTGAISGRSAAAPGGQSTLGAFDEAVMDFGVGAGIVADSVPRAEWEETLQKARVFLDVVDGRPVDERRTDTGPIAEPGAATRGRAGSAR